MFDALSFTEIDEQHADLLPARTVMSLFSTGGGKGGNCNQSTGDSSGLVSLVNNNNILNNIDVIGGGLIPITVLGHQGQCVS